MKTEPVKDAAHVSYDSATGEVCFDYNEEDTELTGYMKLRLYVAAESYDDMDLFVNVQKLSTTGEFLPITLFGEDHPGAWGKTSCVQKKIG